MTRAPLTILLTTALTAGLAPTASATSPAPMAPSGQDFTRQVVASGLPDPYEIEFGPDGMLWATEKSGLRVDRVDTRTGTVTTALDLKETATHDGQAGVLGLAFRTQRNGTNTTHHAYISHSYTNASGGLNTRIVRYTIDSGTLKAPKTLLEGLPASSEHQAGKLRFGPDGKLYFTIGDQGANFSANRCTPNEAQRLPSRQDVTDKNWAAYQGKVLRIEPDGSVPRDNPTLDGVRSHIFAYGFRNPQGLDFTRNGALYSTEQGPRTDDEFNLIRSGGNYGWPHVAGFRDNNNYTYNNWSKASPTPCADIPWNDDPPADVPRATESSYTPPIVEPLSTLGSTATPDTDFRNPECAPMYYLCHPTIAPSSLTAYNRRSGGIPGWDGSAIVTALKVGTIYRVTPGRDGTTTYSPLWVEANRWRDTAISPDGRTIYAAADTNGAIRVGGKGTPVHEPQDKGAIIAFTYNGH